MTKRNKGHITMKRQKERQREKENDQTQTKKCSACFYYKSKALLSDVAQNENVGNHKYKIILLGSGDLAQKCKHLPGKCKVISSIFGTKNKKYIT